ncbi:MAG: hypothetical protein V1809_00685 [Planctomycetota bacterium]
MGNSTFDYLMKRAKEKKATAVPTPLKAAPTAPSSGAPAASPAVAGTGGAVPGAVPAARPAPTPGVKRSSVKIAAVPGMKKKAPSNRYVNMAIFFGGPLILLIGGVLLISSLTRKPKPPTQRLSEDELLLREADKAVNEGKEILRSVQGLTDPKERNQRLERAAGALNRGLEIYDNVRSRPQYSGEGFNYLDDNIAEIQALLYQSRKWMTLE